MAVPFTALMTPDSIVFTAPTGKTMTIYSQNAYFKEARDLLKAIQVARAAGDVADMEKLVSHLIGLAEPAKKIVEQANGRVVVRDGVIFFDGEPVYGVLTDRILWGLAEGYDMQPYLKFMENVQQNPSKRAVDELFTFIERAKMGITEDGHILGYKRVRDNYFDIHSGTMDNSPGKIVEMRRNAVDDNASRTCSAGLHFCSQSYLPHFGASRGNRVVIVKVNPADVVSVPADYDAAKVRACRYEVLSEYEGADKHDLLAHKPVFQTDEFRSNGPTFKGYDTAAWTHDFVEGDVVTFIGDDDDGHDTVWNGYSYEVQNTRPGEVMVNGYWIDADQFELSDDDDSSSESEEEEEESSSEDEDEDEGKDSLPEDEDSSSEDEDGNSQADIDYNKGYSAGMAEGKVAFIERGERPSAYLSTGGIGVSPIGTDDYCDGYHDGFYNALANGECGAFDAEVRAFEAAAEADRLTAEARAFEAAAEGWEATQARDFKAASEDARREADLEAPSAPPSPASSQGPVAFRFDPRTGNLFPTR